MTIAPRHICDTANIPASVPVILIFLCEPLVFHAPTAVATIKTPVVAAMNLCIHSVRNSAEGKIPLGQSGHSGHVNPCPLAWRYPPMNISEYKITREASASYLKYIITLL